MTSVYQTSRSKKHSSDEALERLKAFVKHHIEERDRILIEQCESSLYGGNYKLLRKAYVKELKRTKTVAAELEAIVDRIPILAEMDRQLKESGATVGKTEIRCLYDVVLFAEETTKRPDPTTTTRTIAELMRVYFPSIKRCGT